MVAVSSWNVRADLDIVADGDSRHIQRHHTPVQEAAELRSRSDTVITVEGRPDLTALTERAQQLGQDRAMCRRVGSAMLS